METLIPDRLATLGHPQRLAIFRLLMRRHPDRLPAGEIAQALGLKASTLSAYLAALMQAGLVQQERAGTSLRYSIALGAVRDTLDYLALDCCRGRPEVCSPTSRPGHRAFGTAQDRKFNVLFICTGNSARSLFAEAILRDHAGDRFNAYSAGTNPAPEPNPCALDLLKANGHDISTLRAKTLDAFTSPEAPALDFVFTVCNQAANEECPAWEGQPISGHWGVPDPVTAEGGGPEKRRAFRAAYGALQARIAAFTALPIATLDRIALQAAIDDIAHLAKD